MSTPTPTPDPWIADGYDLRQKNGRMIAYFGPHHTPADEYPLACRLQDEANAQWVAAARNELAAAQAECERLKFATEGHLLKTIQQQAELARLRAQNDQFSDNLSAVGKAYNAEKDRAEKAETELACEKENRNHLIEKGAKLETELTAACSLQTLACRKLDAAEIELATERAIVSRIWVQLGSPTYADLKGRSIYDLIDEIKTDRAEVERLKGALELGQKNCDDIYNDMRDERTKLHARAERAEAALAEWSVLNLWGGTPEIIHEFIKGQQNRIHHCQDLEAECLEQARLLGMSGEREADLLGKLERLRAEVERLKELLRIESASAQHALAAAERAEAELSDERARLDWLLDRSAQTHHSYSNPLGGGNYVQYHKDRAAIDAAMKP